MPVAVEQIAGGYEVALNSSRTDQFSIWNTDSNGNFSPIRSPSGSSTALETLETSFHQDLNGDGVIGVPTTMIEALWFDRPGSGRQQLLPRSCFRGTWPGTEIHGTAVVAGQFGRLCADRREQIAGGYEVAWDAGTDNSRSGIPTATATSSPLRFTREQTALETLETSFQQDLNGDGVIGVSSTTIEAFGATSLVQIGSNYFLNPVAGGAGQELKYNGSPVVAGQFDPYVPVGVEQIAGGY